MNPVAMQMASLTDEEKEETIAIHFRAIMETLGLDLTDPSLAKTPNRVARMYIREIFAGLKPENFPSMTLLEEDMHHPSGSHTIHTKVHFTSFCEHHFVPFVGFAHVAYVPQSKLLGLSKIPRLVRYFAARPQLQERLTAQIADALSLILEIPDVAVSLEAQHYCVIARGVENTQSLTLTHTLRGQFHSDPLLRQEFMSHLKFD